MKKGNRIRRFFQKKDNNIIPHNFVRYSDELFLCDDCKELGFCKEEEKRKIARERELGLNQELTFKDLTSLIPLRISQSVVDNYSQQRLQIAYDAFHQEDYETAYFHFKVDIEHGKSTKDCYLALALCCYKMNDFENAKRYAANYTFPTSSMENGFMEMCEEGMKLEYKNISIGIELKEKNTMLFLPINAETLAK